MVITRSDKNFKMSFCISTPEILTTAVVRVYFDGSYDFVRVFSKFRLNLTLSDEDLLKLNELYTLHRDRGDIVGSETMELYISTSIDKDVLSVKERYQSVLSAFHNMMTDVVEQIKQTIKES